MMRRPCPYFPMFLYGIRYYCDLLIPSIRAYDLKPNTTDYSYGNMSSNYFLESVRALVECSRYYSILK